MRIGIQTWGSRGDIMPLLALADGLQGAGHTAEVVYTSIDGTDYSDIVRKNALTAQAAASPVISNPAQLAYINAHIFAQTSPLKQVRMILDELFVPALEPMMDSAERLCRNADVVIGHFFHYPLRIAAQKAGRPYVSVMPVHSAVPSAHVPPSGLPDLGPTVNRLWWRLARGLMNRQIKPYADRLCTEHGQPPAHDLIDDVWTSPDLNLIPVSRSICLRQDDWGPQHKVCGAFRFPVPDSDENGLDADLESFLSSGPPPVFSGFGSVMPTGISAQQETIDVLVETARLTKCRMIIQAPLWAECGVHPGDHIHFVAAAPHAKVFPRCATVIHHGGAGTTHAALRAGVPSVVVAHIDEQRFWGQELNRIGAAPDVLKRRNLTPKRLARRLNEALVSVDMRDRARTAASIMRTEHGVATAVAAIAAKFPEKI